VAGASVAGATEAGASVAGVDAEGVVPAHAAIDTIMAKATTQTKSFFNVLIGYPPSFLKA
jgi:hypothetical protein